MRIGINGKEANSGQVYANMDTTVTSSQYTVDGQLLSRLGTLVTVENANDEFFLTFEQIDNRQSAYDYTEADPVAASVPVGVEMLSKIGVRTFDEINATMSAVTGVAVTNTQISDKFNLYKRQLPAVEDVQAYLSSHQMAVAQLAMKYCDVLVETAPAYFTPFNFAQPPSVVLATTTDRNNVLNPLLKSIMNVDLLSPAKNLGSQPAEGDIRDALSSSAKVALGEGYTADFDSLMQCMARCAVGGVGAVKCDIYTGGVQGQSCTLAEVSAQNTATRTKQVVKASCAAMLGSAVMLIQ